jgi:carbon-monoxide dehydrogenase small subunit
MRIAFTVNGEAVEAMVPVRRNLVDFLRDDLGLTGSHVGCEHGVCGACVVVVDGAIMRGCLLLAVQADGCDIETIEGADESGRIASLQAAFHRRNALQCGFCTPAMLLTAAAFLAQNKNPTREQIRDSLSGNFCRCTGYQAIVDAIAEVAASGKRAANSNGGATA